MFAAALVLNIVVLLPVITGLFGNSANMVAAFGPDTDARRILTCLYCAIALVSLGLLGLLALNHPWAIPMIVALFAVQITYKLATVWIVGVSSPVVITNLVVVGVQVVVLAVFAARAGSVAG